MTKKQVTYIILIAFVFGAAGSIIFGRFLIPYVASFPGFSGLNKLVTSSPIVVNRREEVQLNEGVNLIDLIKKSGNFTVGIYGPKNNFLGNGIIVTSDGLIMTTDSVADGLSKLTIMTNDGQSLPAETKLSDPKSHLALISIKATGLPIAQFDDAAGLEPGQRVIYLGRSNVKFEHKAAAGFVNQSLSNQPDGKQVSTDAVLGPDYFGGPIVNLSGNVAGIVVNNSQNIISENLKAFLNNYFTTVNTK